jgi:hypothetical protein
MSWNPCLEPTCPSGEAVDAIETLIVPRARDLGGFEVRRALPAPKRQMVGPFIFFDQMGPAEFLTARTPTSALPPSLISTAASSSIATASAPTK